MKRKTFSIYSDATNVLRGMLMGGADVIPGVSGGTVALIIGIYGRLVNAISRFDLTLLGCVRQRRWSAAVDHVDLRFLVTLGGGILLGILALGRLMNPLFATDSTRPPTLAAFFGMIFASGILVAQMIRIRSRFELFLAVGLAICGAIVAYWLTGLTQVDAEFTYGYVFLCGAVAICAMILPGISGAYILLILGLYFHLTEIIEAVTNLNVSAGDALTVAVFVMGCAVGLLSFSKLLRWLLERHQSQTMAVLCGFMFGALRSIWPFKVDLTPEVEKFKLKRFLNFIPDALNGQVLLCLAMAVVAAVAVFTLDRLTHGHEQRPLNGGGEPSDNSGG